MITRVKDLTKTKNKHEATAYSVKVKNKNKNFHIFKDAYNYDFAIKLV